MHGQTAEGYRLDPRASLAWRISAHADALAVPDPAPDGILTAGLFDATGTPIAGAQCWTSETAPATLPPEPTPPVETLPGTHLFGGVLSGHFGHLVCEGTARLWALDQPGIRPDGLVYFSRGPGRSHRIVKRARPLLDALGIDLPCRILDRPTRIETALVAPQAFGTEGLLTGTPDFRHFIRSRLAPPGPHPHRTRKIYISRANLPARRGVLLGEPGLETLLAAEGFEIYRPEEHPLAHQLETYRTAAAIVATEGSPLHLVGFAAPRGCPVVILQRRLDGPAEAIADSLNRFLLCAPALVPPRPGGWTVRTRRDRVTLHAIDMPATLAVLRDRGLISDQPGSAPEAKAIAEDLARIAAETEGHIADLIDPPETDTAKANSP